MTADILGIAVPLLSSSLRLSVPLIFACLAGLWSERSGIFDIGLEGKMLIAAFASAAAAHATGSALAKGRSSRCSTNSAPKRSHRRQSAPYTCGCDAEAQRTPPNASTASSARSSYQPQPSKATLPCGVRKR